jgi:hypothetical protein
MATRVPAGRRASAEQAWAVKCFKSHCAALLLRHALLSEPGNVAIMPYSSMSGGRCRVEVESVRWVMALEIQEA